MKDESGDALSGSPIDNAVFLSFPPPPPAHDDDDDDDVKVDSHNTDDKHKADDHNIEDDMDDYMGFGDSDAEA